MSEGRLLVVTGPGGVGKGTVVEALRAARPEIAVSVSMTTRPPRPGEVDGVHYLFASADEFDKLVAADGFVEWAQFGGNRYGTPWSSVRDALAEGRTVLLEIEVQGALQVRDRFPQALLVFLRPPDEAELLARLHKRGTDSEERIAERMRIGEWELAQADKFDFVVVNDEVDAAAQRISSILDQSV